MEFLEYFWPDNPVAKGVVIFLICLFVVWLTRLVSSFVGLWVFRARAEQCADVEILSEALQGKADQDEESSQKEVGNVPDAGPGSVPLEAESAFFKFCQVKSLRERSPLCKHIRAIFHAGWRESRLDVGELTKNTTNQLFQRNNVLRALLALFIVIGLFGTLFGLGHSLAQLAPALDEALKTPGSGGRSPIVEALKVLLTNLKSAFAPSICGVGLTIVGVIIFSVYLRVGCAPAKTTLDSLTLTTWVPQLMPTAPQRLLQLSEERVRDSFKAAHEVAEFAKSIKKEAGEFSGNLESANKVLTGLDGSASQIDGFANKFAEGVGKLTSFQEEIRSLYKQMQNESKAFQKNVKESISGSEEFHKRVQDILSDQNRELEKVLKALNTYEKAYVEERGQIDAKMKGVLDAAKKAFGGIDAKNQELVKKIGEPLVKKLGEMEETMLAGLAGIRQQLAAFDKPMTRAAEKIEGSFEVFDRRTDTLLKELQQEFQKQNEESKTQTENVSKLSEEIVKALDSLSKNAQTQGASAQGFKESADKLAGDVASLGSRIESLDRTREGPPKRRIEFPGWQKNSGGAKVQEPPSGNDSKIRRFIRWLVD